MAMAHSERKRDASRVVLYKEGSIVTTIGPVVWEPHQEWRKRICYFCGLLGTELHTAMNRCSGCKWAFYCSANCQAEPPRRGAVLLFLTVYANTVCVHLS